MPQFLANFGKEARAKKYSSALHDIKLDVTAQIVQSANGYQVKVSSTKADNIKVAKSLYKDMTEGFDTKAIVDVLRGVFEAKKGANIRLIDNSLIRITPKIAESAIAVHDNLSETSQKAFLIMLGESRESFEGAVKFCLQNNQ
jgi:dihydroxyacetone kinase-like predicted kinase